LPVVRVFIVDDEDHHITNFLAHLRAILSQEESDP
jgi:hypothetical protein